MRAEYDKKANVAMLSMCWVTMRIIEIQASVKSLDNGLCGELVFIILTFLDVRAFVNFVEIRELTSNQKLPLECRCVLNNSKDVTNGLSDIF